MTSEDETFGRGPEDLNVLAERAGAYRRRQLAEAGVGTEFNRDMYVYHRQPRPPFVELAPGWVLLTTIVDGFHSQELRVWWQPETDRLRLQAD